MTPASLEAVPDQQLKVEVARNAKPKSRADRGSAYHRLRSASAYGSRSGPYDADPPAGEPSLRPSQPAGEPPQVKAAIAVAKAFEAEQDSSLALCVESGEPGQSGSSAEQTLLH